MKKPLVSVIIPVYNTGKSAVKLVRFLLKDQYAPDEIIVVDDGSTDDSLRQLKTIKNSTVQIYHQDNAGASAARNLGIQNAKGKYIVFLDSDDEIKPAFMQTLVEAIQKHPHTLPVTGMYRRPHDSRKLTDIYAKKLRARAADESSRDYILWLLVQDGRLYPVVNKIFKADVIRKNNLQFDPKFPLAEDLKFVLDYLKYSSDDILIIQEPLYIYNFNTDTSITNQAASYWTNWQRSFNHLVAWCGKLSPRSMMLLSLIYARWRVSWSKAQKRERAERKQSR